jgi:hypothetical protein
MQSVQELKELLDRQTTVDLWPTAGQALGKTRGSTYEARKRGTIEVLPGGPPFKVASAYLKRILGLEARNG